MTDEPPFDSVELVEFTLIRFDGEWRLWCGCGDVIDLPDVVHGHCVNCHVTCEDSAAHEDHDQHDDQDEQEQASADVHGVSLTHHRGWWNMTCWNGLSTEQQHRLLLVGNLPIDYQPEGWCPNGAQVCIETEHDYAPGPRFYCRACAIRYLQESEEG